MNDTPGKKTGIEVSGPGAFERAQEQGGLDKDSL